MKKVYFLLFLTALLSSRFIYAEVEVKTAEEKLANGKVAFTLYVENGKLAREVYSVTENFAKENNSAPFEISTGGNFALDIFWTYWDAPGKVNNSDVQLHLNKKDFDVREVKKEKTDEGEKLIVSLASEKYGFKLKTEYLLEKDAFFVKKRITVYENVYQTHFLQKINLFDAKFFGIAKVLKKGGYGQPIAFSTKRGGGFIAVEFPTATNEMDEENHLVKTTEILGKKITAEGVSSSWTVVGLTPKSNVKYWFMKYLDDVRVAELVPYTLYNSWYDLRSVEYPGVPKKYWMNEKNVFRIIDEIKSNFVEKHGIKIDAFVLDDGWDVYDSDWQLRKKQFPRGMKPISDKLKEINATLGIWFGPTGGYSFRMRRIKWMMKHGYEVVGDTNHDWQAMLCIGGKNYKALFKKRVTDFVKNADVGYYKWDGLQFSCSEPDHGHPVGEYSRRAIMESVAEISDAVRALKPDIFLNITSGTWLSPWWLKYANTIWMQGGDYGYSDVPSLSRRDRAITYRDITLYNDFIKNDLWFPIANLMTHGIIKGELQKLGGESEPIDKFTDNAVLYFARGVAMYELYISPDILTDDEWDALAQALKWGKANFEIMKNTEMIGGDPAKGEPYGYAHFGENEAIIAVRNPEIKKGEITFTLSEDYGMSAGAKDLVMEEIYPRDIINDETFECGDKITISLEGYETKIVRFYPKAKSAKPLISGVDYLPLADGSYLLAPTGEYIKLLDKNDTRKIFNSEGKEISFSDLKKELAKIKQPKNSNAFGDGITNSSMRLRPQLNEITQSAEIAMLFRPNAPSDTTALPEITFTVNGKKEKGIVEKQKGKWRWDILKIDKNAKSVFVRGTGENVDGYADVYLITYEKPQGVKVRFEKSEKEILPPRPLPDGTIKKTRQVTKVRVKL